MGVAAVKIKKPANPEPSLTVLQGGATPRRFSMHGGAGSVLGVLQMALVGYGLWRLSQDEPEQIEWLPGPLLLPNVRANPKELEKEAERRFGRISDPDLDSIEWVRRKQAVPYDPKREVLGDDPPYLEIPTREGRRVQIPLGIEQMSGYLRLHDLARNGRAPLHTRAQEELALIQVERERRKKTTPTPDPRILLLEGEIARLLAEGKIMEATQKRVELENLKEQIAAAQKSPLPAGGPLQLQAQASSSDAGSAATPSAAASAAIPPADALPLSFQHLPTHKDVTDCLERRNVDANTLVALFALADRCCADALNRWRSIKDSKPHELLRRVLLNPYVHSDARAMLLEIAYVRASQNPELNRQMTELISNETDGGALTHGIRALYRRHVPQADVVLAAVDHFNARQSADLRKMGGPVRWQDILHRLDSRTYFSQTEILSLLLMGREAISKLGALIAPNGQQKFLSDVKMLRRIFAHPYLWPETKLLAFQLLFEGVETPLETIAPNGVRVDPVAADAEIRRLFIAHYPMGAIILADFDRRNNLPKRRAQELLTALDRDPEVGRAWRTFRFQVKSAGNDAKLQQLMEKAVAFVDGGDAIAQLTIVKTWAKGMIREGAKVDVKNALNDYDPKFDPTGYRAAAMVAEVAHDPQVDPFRFLLLHERRAWDRNWVGGHPSHDLLMRMARFVFNDPKDIVIQYRGLQGDGVLEDANHNLRRAVQGQISGVEPAHVRELMRRAVVEPWEHISLLYWAAIDFSRMQNWATVPTRVVGLLDEARRAGAQVVGNVIELVARDDEFNGMAELQGIRYYLKSGSWVHILPRDMQTFQPTADLVVTDDFGAQDVVEIKNFRYGHEDHLKWLKKSMDKAVLQLDASRKLYPQARGVIFLRVVTDNGSQLPMAVREAIRHYLSQDNYRTIAVVEVDTSSVRDLSARSHETIANPGYSDTARVRASAFMAGPRRALILTDRLVALGIVEATQRNALVTRAAQLPRDAVTMVTEVRPDRELVLEAIARYGLGAALAPFIHKGKPVVNPSSGTGGATHSNARFDDRAFMCLADPEHAEFGPKIRASKAKSAVGPVARMSDGPIPMNDPKTDVTIREGLSAQGIGDILNRVTENTASPSDLATLIVDASSRAMAVLTGYVKNGLKSNSESPFMRAVNNMGVPADARMILVFLHHMNAVDPDDVTEISERIVGAFDPQALLSQSYGTQDTQKREDPNDVIADLYFLFCMSLSEGEAILSAVDSHRQAAVQEMLGKKSLLSAAELKHQAVTHTVSPVGSLTLLLAGEQVVTDTIMAIRTNDRRELPQFARDYMQVAVELLRDPRLSPNQKGMIVDMIRRDLFLAPALQIAVMQFMDRNPVGADRMLRQYYTANVHMGDYVLAEYDRRVNVPEVRAQKALGAALAERERDWRKATFPLRTANALDPLMAMMQRGLQFADIADVPAAKTLAARWVDAVIQSPKQVWQQVQGFTPDQDPSGLHVFTTLMTRTYDSAKDPFGFLLPYQQDLWDRVPNAGHPTIQLLKQIEQTVQADEFLSEYAWLQLPDNFQEAVGIVRQAATGQYEGVDTAAVQELMRRSVQDLQLHAALLYWGASIPTKPDQRSRWAQMPGRVSDLLEEARKKESTVVGNVLELLLRCDGAGYDGVAEMAALRHFANQRGSWIRILPLDYRHHHKVADLLVVGQSGRLKLVEVKNKLYRNPMDLPAIQRSLTEASEQLASSAEDYKSASRVVYLRLATPNGISNGSPVPPEVETLIQDHLKKDATVSEVMVETANKRISYPNVNLPVYTNGNAGPRRARRLADQLLRLGIIKPETHDAVLGRLAASPTEAVDHVLAMPPSRVREAVQRYGLGQVLR